MRRWTQFLITLLLPLSGGCSKAPAAPTNQPPLILDLTLGAPPPFSTGQTILLACSASDPDGDPVTYRWSSATGTFESDVTQSTVMWRAPQLPCQCTVTVSVSDGERTATRSLAIPISGVPIPRFTIEPAAGTAATTFTLDASGSTDAETSTNELEVRWNIESSWSPWTTNKTIQHRFPDVGVKTITLAVRDRDGFVASRDSTIEVQLVPFEVENLGVQFAPFDAGTGQAGDFLFDRIIARVFWEFGARVKDPQGQIKELPHLSYVLPHDAPIVAISEGEVRSVIYQPESEDYEVAVRSMNDPSFDVSYDHLINLGVTLGQRVLPGQVIGRPRPWVGWQVGLVEIMIVNRHTRVAHCPLALVNEVTRAAYEEKVARLMRDWEQFVNDGTVYDEEAWVRPGCRFDSMQAY